MTDNEKKAKYFIDGIWLLAVLYEISRSSVRKTRRNKRP